MTKLYKTLSCLASVMLLILMIFLVIHFLGLNKGIYGSLQRRYQVNADIGISQNDLDSVTDVFIDYTKGKAESISVMVDVDGETQEMFNERETLHMVDVKNLYVSMMNICYVFAVLIILIFGFLFISKRKDIIFSMHNKVSVGFIVFCVMLGIYFMVDFNSFWTNVHLILFTNDLWLLNPMTDRMILMFPLDFFFSLSIIVLSVFAVVFVALMIITKRLSKKAIAV